jgi:hypothetical protein
MLVTESIMPSGLRPQRTRAHRRPEYACPQGLPRFVLLRIPNNDDWLANFPWFASSLGSLFPCPRSACALWPSPWPRDPVRQQPMQPCNACNKKRATTHGAAASSNSHLSPHPCPRDHQPPRRAPRSARSTGIAMCFGNAAGEPAPSASPD